MQQNKVEKLSGISRFCFGCEPLGGTDWGDDIDVSAIEEAIHVALDRGVSFFDTSDVYGLGLSEQRLAKILGHKRHDVMLATKGGVAWKQDGAGRAVTRIDGSPEYIKAAVERSLKRLKVDKLPIYYIHWPDTSLDVGVTVDALYDLQLSGKIGHIGCSNFSAEQLSRAIEIAPIRFLQIPVNLLEGPPSDEVIKLCAQHSVGVVAYNVLASGLLTGKYDVSSLFSSNDRRSRLSGFQGETLSRNLKQVAAFSVEAERLQMRLTQYCIDRVLKMPSVEAVIIGIKTRQQLEENIEPFFCDRGEEEHGH